VSQDREEPSELEALFERSAQRLDPVTRGRLRAHARAVPERKAGILLLPSLWAGASALAALGAAGAVFLSLDTPRSSLGTPGAPARHGSATPAVLSAEPVASLAAPALEAEDASSEESDELAIGGELDDPMSPDVLDDLALDPGDLADGDVDAWISAAGSALGG